MNKKLKRWTFLDTLNGILFVVVVLFFLDFQNNSTMSWILLAVFLFWLITVILRNVMISKIEKDPDHPLHKVQTNQHTEIKKWGASAPHFLMTLILFHNSHLRFLLYLLRIKHYQELFLVAALLKPWHFFFLQSNSDSCNTSLKR